MIICESLVLGYRQPIATKFNLVIEQNKWFGIIGENGIGKSTFLKTILGNLKPISGSITIDGLKCGKANDLIAYIPQEREINLNEKFSAFTLIKISYRGWKYGLPIYQNIVKNKAVDLLKLVGATEYMHQPFNSLSGGQKKRIYLAQALINQPKILLLDEPLADLDPNAKQHFVKSLQQIHKTQQLTLLIISHDMHEIAVYLDGFIHFKKDSVHMCAQLPCIREGAYVGI